MAVGVLFSGARLNPQDNKTVPTTRQLGLLSPL